jgi:hypothetical protein
MFSLELGELGQFAMAEFRFPKHPKKHPKNDLLASKMTLSR